MSVSSGYIEVWLCVIFTADGGDWQSLTSAVIYMTAWDNPPLHEHTHMHTQTHARTPKRAISNHWRLLPNVGIFDIVISRVSVYVCVCVCVFLGVRLLC